MSSNTEKGSPDDVKSSIPEPIISHQLLANPPGKKKDGKGGDVDGNPKFPASANETSDGEMENGGSDGIPLEPPDSRGLRERDVVRARGFSYRTHLGNAVLVEQVEKRAHAYGMGNRKQKDDLILAVIKLMKKNGTRFMVKDSEGKFVEASQDGTTELVRQVFNPRLPKRFIVHAKDGTDPAGVAPREYDVLSGRGKSSYNHPGNQFYRSRIDMHAKRYTDPSTSAAEKHRIIREINHAITERGGRFLRYKRQDDVYILISEMEANEKTCQALRDSLRPGRNTQSRVNRVQKNETAVLKMLPIRGQQHLDRLKRIEIAAKAAASAAYSAAYENKQAGKITATSEELALAGVLPQDILCGGGYPSRDHVGNSQCRAMVNHFLEEYLATDPTRRHHLCREIALAIKKQGGRFLKYNMFNEGWQEAQEAEACTEVLQLFNDIAVKGDMTLGEEDDEFDIDDIGADDFPFEKVAEAGTVTSRASTYGGTYRNEDVLFSSSASKVELFDDDHPGNIHMSVLLEDYQPFYLAQVRLVERKRIVTSIVREIRSHGGRFLIGDDDTGLWKRISNQSAHTKIMTILSEGEEEVVEVDERQSERKTLQWPYMMGRPPTQDDESRANDGSGKVGQKTIRKAENKSESFTSARDRLFAALRGSGGDDDDEEEENVKDSGTQAEERIDRSFQGRSDAMPEQKNMSPQPKHPPSGHPVPYYGHYPSAWHMPQHAAAVHAAASQQVRPRAVTHEGPSPRHTKTGKPVQSSPARHSGEATAVASPGKAIKKKTATKQATPQLFRDLPQPVANTYLRTRRVPQMPPASALVKPSNVGVAKYTDRDVVSGRGGLSNHHPGNIYLRSWIEKMKPAYMRAPKFEKSRIAMMIVMIVRETGGRFLKIDQSTHLWTEIGDLRARDKVSQGLREVYMYKKTSQDPKSADPTEDADIQLVSVREVQNSLKSGKTNLRYRYVPTPMNSGAGGSSRNVAPQTVPSSATAQKQSHPAAQTQQRKSLESVPQANASPSIVAKPSSHMMNQPGGAQSISIAPAATVVTVTHQQQFMQPHPGPAASNIGQQQLMQQPGSTVAGISHQQQFMHAAGGVVTVNPQQQFLQQPATAASINPQQQFIQQPGTVAATGLNAQQQQLSQPSRPDGAALGQHYAHVPHAPARQGPGTQPGVDSTPVGKTISTIEQQQHQISQQLHQVQQLQAQQMAQMQNIRMQQQFQAVQIARQTQIVPGTQGGTPIAAAGAQVQAQAAPFGAVAVAVAPQQMHHLAHIQQIQTFQPTIHCTGQAPAALQAQQAAPSLAHAHQMVPPPWQVQATTPVAAAATASATEKEAQ